MSKLGKSVAVLGTVVLVVLATASQASAGNRWTYRSTSSSASTEWIEFGDLGLPVLGNVHVGYLEVYGGSSSADVFGSVADWTCPDGELPPGGGGPHFFFEEEPPPTNCEFHSERFIWGNPDEVSFSMDKKLGSAHLTGVLNVEDHATGQGGRPPVDIVWTGIGDTSSSSSTGKFNEGGSTYSWKESSTSRQAIIADGSYIGAMGFTDDDDDTSSGSMQRSKYYETSRSK